MSDAEALRRVLTLVRETEKGVSPAAWSWWDQHEGALWVLEGLLEALEDDE
jgi:hypothetical protein